MNCSKHLQDEMEKRNSKISFSKAGNGLGAKATLSVPLLKKFGITTEERNIEIIYDEARQEIIIRKKK